MPAFYEEEELLKPIFRKGELVYSLPSLQKIRERAGVQLEGFDKTHKRLTNPHVYPVGLEEHLHHLRMELVIAAKNSQNDKNEI
jgi:nicotinate phosphoribosyltransferase